MRFSPKNAQVWFTAIHKNGFSGHESIESLRIGEIFEMCYIS